MSRALCIALLFLPSLVRGEVFRLLDGTSVEGQITGIYGELVVLKTSAGSHRLHLNTLDDESLRGAAAFLRNAPAPAPWNSTKSNVGRALARRLRILQAGKLAPFDPGTRPEPEFYVVYFGARWCPPCVRFSPTLASTYAALKAIAPDRFEVIFFSDDHDASAQAAYMREAGMSWPTVRHGARVPILERWRGDGIPCLIVVNRDGDLIFNSYRGDEYLGALDPLEKFQALLGHLSRPDRPMPGLHRLAIAQHLDAANNGEATVRPYFISIDPRRNRTLPKEGVTARVTINDKGQVQEIEFTPQLTAVVEAQLRRESEHWLFLPAIRQGRLVEATVSFPLVLDPS